MHATARRRNIERTILVHLAGAIGSTLVHADDRAFNPSASSEFVRVRVEDSSATFAHRIEGDPAYLAVVRLVAEVYCRTNEAQVVAAIDAADAVAERVTHAIRARSLNVKDYVTDPTGGTTATGYSVRFVDTPTVTAPDSVDGWARRIVTGYAFFILRHSE